MFADVKKGDDCMAENKKIQAYIESMPVEEIHFVTFGERLREIRKEMNMTQDEFAKKVGTSKQMLSRYELDQRTPKIDQVLKYAQKLNVSVDYMIHDTEFEASFRELCESLRGKPFYEIFIEITYDILGLNIPQVCGVTGLTDHQVRTIITRRMKDAPLTIAMRLSETLQIPLTVWMGKEAYVPTELSPYALQVARAYDKASLKDRNMARMALNLDTIKE